MTTPTLDLSIELLKRPSVTPKDENCQNIIADRLANSGFVSEFMYFGEGDTERNAQVKNLWARRGNASPLVCFLGHTDVVPTGDEKNWTYPPFEPTIKDGYLYARGASDMKTAIACFTVACENFVKKHPNHNGSIALLLTSDEEGPSVNGTVKVVETLENRQEKIDYCLVGEPSGTNVLGDVIKNGRRGSLGGVLTVTGKQGHVAYPHLAVNPIHYAMPALNDLVAQTWDNGNDYFPPTTMQISNLNAGTGANNVIPQTLTAEFNFRFSTETNETELKAKTYAIFDKYFTDGKASFTVDWKLSGKPFLTEQGKLVNACQTAIKNVMNIDTELSTSGGTSDGRFVAPTGAQVVELGVLNATIHQVNECVAVDDLKKLTAIYEQILENLLT
nr:succinyl-diaminopimelate desuccinylase [uncultured Moraxella sp.]